MLRTSNLSTRRHLLPSPQLTNTMRSNSKVRSRHSSWSDLEGQRFRTAMVKVSYERGAWSEAEDNGLLRLVNMHGPASWDSIAQLHMVRRSGKQCRERWFNHVNPSIVRTPFTSEEDSVIIALHGCIGSKWAEMSKRLKGRPANSIKNHFKTNLSQRCGLAGELAVQQRQPSRESSSYSSMSPEPVELPQTHTYSPAVSSDAGRNAAQRKGVNTALPVIYEQAAEPQQASRSSFTAPQPSQTRPAYLLRTASAPSVYRLQSIVSSPLAPPSHASPLDYARQAEYRHVGQQDSQSAYMQSRHDAAWVATQQHPGAATTTVERSLGAVNAITPRPYNAAAAEMAGPIARHQPALLPSWRRIDDERVLPPLSHVVAAAARDSLHIHRPCTQPSMARLTPSVALPPLVRQQRSSSLQHFTVSGSLNNFKRTVSDMDDVVVDERPRQRPRDASASSLLEKRSYGPMLLSPISPFRAFASPAANSAAATSQASSYLSPDGRLIMAGSTLANTRNPPCSPMQTQSIGDAPDYFGSPSRVNYNTGSSYRFANVSYAPHSR